MTACAIIWVIFVLLPPAIIIVASSYDKKNRGGPSWFWWGLGAYYLIGIFLIPRLDFCMDPYWYLN
jgi:uncharacterized protein YqgC (DUF456 family)